LRLKFLIYMKRIIGAILGLVVVINVNAQSNEREVQPDIPGDIMVDIGFNSFRNHPDFMNIKWFSSRSLSVYYQYTKKISDRFTFNPAIGVSSEKYSFENNLNFMLNDDRTVSFDTISGVFLRKNKLVVNYIELPLEIRFFPTKTIDGEGFFIGLGGVAGYRIESHTNIKYDIGGEKAAEKTRSDFGLQNYRLGAQIRVGWKAISIYSKIYLTDPFNAGPFGANPTTFTVGLNFTGF